jgi:hypothetical protein
VTDAISKRAQGRNNDLRSALQAAWLESPIRRTDGRKTPTWEAFSERFDRCFHHVAVYVRQRVIDREKFGHIVTEVLSRNIDLFLTPRDEREEVRFLNASSDRLLAFEGGSHPR